MKMFYKFLSLIALAISETGFLVMLINFFVKTPDWADKIKAVRSFENSVNVDSVYGLNVKYKFGKNFISKRRHNTDYRFLVTSGNRKDSVLITLDDETGKQVVKVTHF